MSAPTLVSRPGTRRCATAPLLGAVLVALLLGGCRSGDRAAAPGTAPSVPPSTVAPGGSSAPDPLARLEAVVGAVERDLDADAAVAGR